MARHHFWKYVLDSSGNVVEGASVNIYKANSTTAATVFAAVSGGSEVNATPQVVSDTNGFAEFWIDDTIYNQYQELKVELSHSQLTNVVVDYINIPRVSEGWKKVTANYIAKTGDRLLADTTGGAFYVKLPASPSTGYTTEIQDASGNFGTDNLTASGNGNVIRGGSGELVASTNWTRYSFVFVDATSGWVY